MTDTGEGTDPRPQLSSALDQTQRQVSALNAGDLGRSTPCAEYDVRTLLGHVVAVLRKLAAVGRGDAMSAVTDPADDIDNRGIDEFHMARADLEQVWAADAMLDKSHTLTWVGHPDRPRTDRRLHPRVHDPRLGPCPRHRTRERP